MTAASASLAPPRNRSALRRALDWIANPWARPRFLVLVTWLYVFWSIVPVVIAIHSPSMTAARSRPGRASH